MNSDLQQLHEFTKDLAREVGAEVERVRRGGNLKQSLKSGTELQTEADLLAEKLIMEGIEKHYPGHQVLAEETASRLDGFPECAGPLWIIDPIDGTNNFARGSSHYAISIAFADNGEVLSGVVFGPAKDRMCSAIKNGGAWINDQSIVAEKNVPLNESVFLIGTAGTRRDLESRADFFAKLNQLMDIVPDFRREGSAALDIVSAAAGEAVGFYEMGLSPWDTAASVLFAKEAGARFFSEDGEAEQVTLEFLAKKEVLVAQPGNADVFQNCFFG